VNCIDFQVLLTPAFLRFLRAYCRRKCVISHLLHRLTCFTSDPFCIHPLKPLCDLSVGGAPIPDRLDIIAPTIYKLFGSARSSAVFCFSNSVLSYRYNMTIRNKLEAGKWTSSRTQYSMSHTDPLRSDQRQRTPFFRERLHLRHQAETRLPPPCIRAVSYHLPERRPSADGGRVSSMSTSSSLKAGLHVSDKDPAFLPAVKREPVQESISRSEHE